MNFNIRERWQKVWACLQRNAQQSVRDIARATGIAKSSVQRHLQAIRGRQQYPESFLWETEEGEQWLARLVFGVIYCFGIKEGSGAKSLSNFFHLLRLERRVGCSESALRKMKAQVKEKIITYGKEQAAACQSASPIDICLGADETFYDLPILVAIELSSGFILSEAECENRTYERWQALVSEWYQPQQCRVRVLVSDGAKALVKLALSGLGCPSMPDVFHLLYGLSKSMGAAIERQRVRLHNQQQALQAKQSNKAKVAEQMQSLQSQQQILETDQQQYQQSLHALSQAIHPFEITTSESQFARDLAPCLQPHMATLERLSQTYAQNQSQSALQRFQQQIPALGAALDAWWQWVLQALCSQTQDLDTQNWVLTALLPWVYWHQQTEKTRQNQLKQAYQQATQRAHERLFNHPFTSTRSDGEQQQWIDWAIWMCAKFQRTSSAVEGRNGYLSALHHANRGFTQQTLKALTIIHNFDIQRSDGSTAAQRLFGKPFPSLFEFVVLNMGELPRPRQSRKPKKSKIPTLQAVPL